jgi:hypothetical protein
MKSTNNNCSKLLFCNKIEVALRTLIGETYKNRSYGSQMCKYLVREWTYGVELAFNDLKRTYWHIFCSRIGNVGYYCIFLGEADLTREVSLKNFTFTLYY